MKNVLEARSEREMSVDFAVDVNGQFHFGVWTYEPEIAKQVLGFLTSIQKEKMVQIQEEITKQDSKEKVGVF